MILLLVSEKEREDYICKESGGDHFHNWHLDMSYYEDGSISREEAKVRIARYVLQTMLTKRSDWRWRLMSKQEILRQIKR